MGYVTFSPHLCALGHSQVRRATGTIARNKTKRDFIRDELVDTEKGYLDALRSIQKVYVELLT